MIRTAVVRALLALVPLLLSGWLALTQTLASTCAAARRSGYRPRTPRPVTADAPGTDRVLEVLRERFDALSVAEPDAGPLARAAHHRGAAGSAGLCQGRRGLDQTAQLTALALLIGIVAGTASTVSVAAPLAIKLHAHRPSALTPTRRRAPKRAVSGAVV